MKPPISYYGGKQVLASRIVKLIPEHRVYVEPFLGGAAVFFHKTPAPLEVINDTNRELINFYQVVQNDFVGLEKHIRITLHSRDHHRKATVIYNNPDMFSEIQRAWAVWVLANQSFSSQLGGHWGYDKKKDHMAKKLNGKKEGFSEELAIRLQNVQIECADALRIIRARDTEHTFFYLDPPYHNSDMGHYDGYTVDDFVALLTLASKIEGNFLLSSYPSKELETFTKEMGWHTLTFDSLVSVNNTGRGKRKTKTEVLTANYPIKL